MHDIVFVLIGLGVALQGGRLGFGTLTEPGPGFMPVIVGTALFVFGAAQALMTLRESAARPVPATALDPAARSTIAREPLLLLAALGAYVALLPLAGYLVATALLVVAVLRLMGVTGIGRLALGSVIAAVTSYVLFGRLLGIDLPRGLLPV